MHKPGRRAGKAAVPVVSTASARLEACLGAKAFKLLLVEAATRRPVTLPAWTLCRSFLPELVFMSKPTNAHQLCAEPL